MRWLGRLLGLPHDWTGVIYDTASIAGFTALAAAREALGLGIREEGMTGRELPRAARLRHRARRTRTSRRRRSRSASDSDNVVRVACDDAFRMRPDALDAAIRSRRRRRNAPARDRRDRRDDVDDVGRSAARDRRDRSAARRLAARRCGVRRNRSDRPGVSRLARRRRAGGFARRQPAQVAVRPDGLLRALPEGRGASFAARSALCRSYLDDARSRARSTTWTTACSSAGAFERSNCGSCCAVWAREGIRDRLRAHVALAQELARWIRDEPDWEMLAPHPLSVVCFRYAPPGFDEARSRRSTPRSSRPSTRPARSSSRTRRSAARYAIRLAIGNLRTDARRRRARLGACSQKRNAAQHVAPRLIQPRYCSRSQGCTARR